MSLYEFAGELFDLEIRSEHVKRICRGYEAQVYDRDAIPLFVSDEELAYERSLEPLGTDGLFEETALYRKICRHMIDAGGFVFHSSALALDGKGYLFTAVSGTGKSTHTRLWRQAFGKRVTMINDDKPLIKKTGEGVFRVYGTPWCGKEGIQNNTSAPVAAIAILERAERNTVTRVTDPSKAFPVLFNQTYRPRDPAAMGRLLDLFAEWIHATPLYILRVNMDPEAAYVAMEGMKG